MKTSDLIAKRIKMSADVAFGVQGGCVVNLVDSMHKAGIKLVSMHHEQSAAIAADAYARFKPLGVCYGTSGPGTTNLLTGTCCSYYDSIPVLTLGGQVPSKFLDGIDRQTGFQETDGVRLFEPITKLSRRYRQFADLEKAIYIAKRPRRGPVFLEIPDDVQRMDTDEEIGPIENQGVGEEFKLDLMHYQRPIAIIGAGARDSILEINIPFLYTWAMKDACFGHPLCKGDFGITGSPYGNRLLKQADCIVMIGTRMDTHQVPDWSGFAPQATKISVGMQFPHQVHIRYDIGLRRRVKIGGYKMNKDWCIPGDPNASDGPMYRWIDELSEQADPEDIIIPDMGQTGCITWQRWKMKHGQRMFNGMNHSPMGYSLPGAIGAALATGQRVIVIVGEGSLMMNLQDLATISDLNLPINIRVVENGGYGMIRQTQADWPEFLDEGVGCDFITPSVEVLSQAFGIEYTNELKDVATIWREGFEDTKIQPKWKYGEDL